MIMTNDKKAYLTPTIKDLRELGCNKLATELEKEEEIQSE
jgi:hypothetical protein